MSCCIEPDIAHRVRLEDNRAGLEYALELNDESVDELEAPLPSAMESGTMPVPREYYRVLRPGGRLLLEGLVQEGWAVSEDEGTLLGAGELHLFLEAAGFSRISMAVEDEPVAEAVDGRRYRAVVAAQKR